MAPKSGRSAGMSAQQRWMRADRPSSTAAPPPSATWPVPWGRSRRWPCSDTALMICGSTDLHECTLRLKAAVSCVGQGTGSAWGLLLATRQEPALINHKSAWLARLRLELCKPAALSCPLAAENCLMTYLIEDLSCLLLRQLITHTSNAHIKCMQSLIWSTHFHHPDILCDKGWNNKHRLTHEIAAYREGIQVTPGELPRDELPQHLYTSLHQPPEQTLTMACCCR